MKIHPVRTLLVVLSLFAVAQIARDKAHFIDQAAAPKSKVSSSAPTSRSVVPAPTRATEAVEKLPTWAVPFGKEFWRRPSQAATAAAKSSPGTPELPPSINLGDIMDRVAFAFRDENKVSCVNGPAYRAEVGSSGVRFTPFLPDETREDRRPTSDGTVATLRTKQIRISGPATSVAGVAQSEPVVAGNTVQRLLNRDGIVEHVESTEKGLAISWVIPQRPAAGDLTVDFQIAGLQYLDRSEQGYHFADASGTPRVCVGKATLVDSSNAKWDLTTKFEDGALQITASADLLARAQYPIAIDPVVMPEFAIDTYVVPSTQDEHVPAVASNSGQFLVVWHNSTNMVNQHPTPACSIGR